VLNRPAAVYLWTRPEAAAGAWLGEHTEAQDVLLGSIEFSNAAVGSMDGRVVVGHVVATLRSAEKEALVGRFFAATSPEERSSLLQQSGATYVVLGPSERALGATSLDAQPDLARVYDVQGVQIYKVRR
jgi:hypothetical protein